MLVNRYVFKVRYVETDQMGIVNNAHYPTYFEMGRTELFREIGVTYADMEREGIMLPVSELMVKYYKPACYDDELTIETTLAEMPQVRVRFIYKIYNQNNELINEGYSLHAFIDGASRRPIRIPELIKKAIEPCF